jgi:hypothetical protein
MPLVAALEEVRHAAGEQAADHDSDERKDRAKRRIDGPEYRCARLALRRLGGVRRGWTAAMGRPRPPRPERK